MIINIPKALLLRAVTALRYVAQNEAGQSQAPDLISREDTREWADAAEIMKLIKQPDPNAELVGSLQVAIWRLDDMLKGDDGQAWKEAEKAMPYLRTVLETCKS